MFFDDVAEIAKIALRTHCAIFSVPKYQKVEIKGALEVKLEEKKKSISIDQMREIIGHLNHKRNEAICIIIRPADLMSADAANAMLKSFEEPKQNYHFVLITDSPSNILPTILSRAELFYLRQAAPLDAEVVCDTEIKALAKRMITSTGSGLVTLANDIGKNKDNSRAIAMEVTATAIEILYKSYFKTKNSKLLARLPGLLTLYENLGANGNIKLQIVANLC